MSQNRAPHGPDAGEESSGMAPDILGNVQTAAATIEEGANEEFSFWETLEKIFQHVDNVETVEDFQDLTCQILICQALTCCRTRIRWRLMSLVELIPVEMVRSPYRALDSVTVSYADMLQINLDSFIRTSLNSLPFVAPGPIWEYGVGPQSLVIVFHETKFCTLSFSRPSFESCIDEWISQIDDTRRELKEPCRQVVTTVMKTYSRTFLNRGGRKSGCVVTDCKREMAYICDSFNESSVGCQQLALAPDDVGRLTVLCDLFRGNASAILLRRVRAVEEMCQFLRVEISLQVESRFTIFFTYKSAHGDPLSSLQSYLESRICAIFVT